MENKQKTRAPKVGDIIKTQEYMGANYDKRKQPFQNFYVYEIKGNIAYMFGVLDGIYTGKDNKEKPFIIIVNRKQKTAFYNQIRAMRLDSTYELIDSASPREQKSIKSPHKGEEFKREFILARFSEVQEGDIIEAHKPLNNSSMGGVEVYLVIKRTEKELICTQVSANTKELCIQIADKGTICENKPCYARVKNIVIIDINHFVTRASHNIGEDILSRVKKKIWLNSKLGQPAQIEVENYKKGDIVYNLTDNNQYLIIGIEPDNEYTALKTAGLSATLIAQSLDSAYIKYIYPTRVRKDEIKYLNSLNKGQLRVIQEELKQQSALVKEQKIPEGTIIQYGTREITNYFYILKLKALEALGKRAIAVYITNRNKEESISIDNTRYIPHYESLRLIDPTSDNYKVIGLASQEEQKSIGQSIDSYLNMNPNTNTDMFIRKDDDINILSLKDGTLVLVIGVQADTYSVIVVNKLHLDSNPDWAFIPKNATIEAQNITPDEIATCKRYLKQLKDTEKERGLIYTLNGILKQ